MAPKLQPPSSPTSLLWAHQLKREHGFLLNRMQKLEAAIDRVEHSATAAANRSKDEVDHLTRQVQSLAEDTRSNQAIEKVQKEVMDSLEELHAQIEAITDKVAQIDRDVETAAAERKAAEAQEGALLKRVKEIETSLKGYRDNMRSLGRCIDDGRVDQIGKQLDHLAKQAQREGSKMAKIEETMAILEQAGSEIRSSNEKLTEELRSIQTSIERVAAESDPDSSDPRAGDMQAAQGDVEIPATAEAIELVPKPATDRAAAARAARTAKRKNSSQSKSKKASYLETARAVRAERPVAPKASQPEPKPATDKAAAARAARAAKRKRSSENKTALAARSGKKGTAKKIEARPVVPSSQRIDQELKKPVVRSGRGWVEVEATPTPERDLMPEPKTKRGRGRPRREEQNTTVELPGSPAPDELMPATSARKVAIQRSIEHSDEVPTLPKRRAIVQNDNTQAQEIFGGKGKKRKANALADDTIDVDAPRATRRRIEVKQEVQQRNQKKGGRRGLTNVFSSPISSPPPSDDIVKVESQLAPVPKPKRRTIPQQHGDDLLRKYSEGILKA